ncbi:MAG: helix-turn-helix domain-containing protein [Dehalococcoidia bacterium]
MTSWTFLTNHAAALIAIASDPSISIRDVARAVGVTERAAQRIVNELAADGYVSRRRCGNRNAYEVHPDLPFRIPLMQHRQIGQLLAILDTPPPTAAADGAGRTPACRVGSDGAG